MDAINKFIRINSAIDSLHQEEQAKSEETSTNFLNAGISSTPDTFETFPQPKFELPSSQVMENPAAPAQYNTVDAGSFFDLLSANDIKAQGFENSEITNTFAKSAADALAVLNRISQLTGKPVDELQAIFKKYGLKPEELPYPPDEKIIAFLKDPAFSNQNEVKLLWEMYDGFANINVRPPNAPIPNSDVVSPVLDALAPAIENVRNAVIAQELYQKISEFTGKTPAEIQELFKHYHLKPSSLPNPPDYNVYQFLQDPAFGGVSQALLLYEIYGW